MVHVSWRLWCHDKDCDTTDTWGEEGERNCPSCGAAMQALPSPDQIREMSRA